MGARQARLLRYSCVVARLSEDGEGGVVMWKDEQIAFSDGVGWRGKKACMHRNQSLNTGRCYVQALLRSLD